MTTPPDLSPPDESHVDRRSLLAGIASAGVAATAGCAKQAHSVLDRPTPDQISLSITTVPADDDPVATRMARYLAKRLGQVGIDASVTLKRREDLLLDVLYKQSFDCYVWRLPSTARPDVLRPLLHSRFGVEPGWQNPFGYSDLGVDDMLTRQRGLSGSRRRNLLGKVQRRIARTVPFVTVAAPAELRAVRNDRVTNDGGRELHSPVGYLSIDAAGEEEEVSGTVTGGSTTTTTDPETRRLTMTLADSRPTQNLNPLAVEYRNDWTIVGLLYDPLVRWIDGEAVPWLASDVTWEFPDDAPGPEAVVTLRSGATWHDGEAVTAEDVAFTYRFMHDTSLGRLESPLPSPAFRGETTLVRSVQVLDHRRVRVSFVPSTRAVATRALTVPILPKHDWEKTSKQANVPGLKNGPVTRALVRENTNPVGGGPLRFESRSARNSLTLARHDDHFLHRGETSGIPPSVDGFDFDQLSFTVVPSAAVARELVLSGDADASATPLTPESVQAIGADGTVDLHVRPSRSPYHVGFNVRAAPLSNIRFRQAVAHLFDRAYLVDELLGGFGEPMVSPLATDRLVPESLRFTGADPLFPFPGEDGELDVERAKQPFVDAGYRYSNKGALLSR